MLPVLFFAPSKWRKYCILVIFMFLKKSWDQQFSCIHTQKSIRTNHATPNSRDCIIDTYIIVGLALSYKFSYLSNYCFTGGSLTGFLDSLTFYKFFRSKLHEKKEIEEKNREKKKKTRKRKKSEREKEKKKKKVNGKKKKK